MAQDGGQQVVEWNFLLQPLQFVDHLRRRTVDHDVVEDYLDALFLGPRPPAGVGVHRPPGTLPGNGFGGRIGRRDHDQSGDSTRQIGLCGPVKHWHGFVQDRDQFVERARDPGN